MKFNIFIYIWSYVMYNKNWAKTHVTSPLGYVKGAFEYVFIYFGEWGGGVLSLHNSTLAGTA